MNRLVLATGSMLVVFALAMTVLAQEATSTEPVDAFASTMTEQATTTDAIAAISEATTTSDSVVVEEATTTQAASSTDETPLVLGESAPTAAELTSTGTTPAIIVENRATEPSSIEAQDIASLEDSYFAKNGKYLQIIPGNLLPDYETGTVIEKLGANIPADARVNVYESPKGFGYQVVYQDMGAVYAVGYGPEAADRTYSYPVPTISASSTSTSTAPISTNGIVL